MSATSHEVLHFWFEETDSKYWFTQSDQFDQLLQHRFLTLLECARAAELSHWRGTARGRLAEIIVLDQFSRNIFRGTAAAFAQDAAALILAQEAVRCQALSELAPAECAFLLMPYMHSESKIIHQHAEGLFREYAPANLSYELQHRAIIERFGRYPHGNSILGRPSSAEEEEFLTQPGSSF